MRLKDKFFNSVGQSSSTNTSQEEVFFIHGVLDEELSTEGNTTILKIIIDKTFGEINAVYEYLPLIVLIEPGPLLFSIKKENGVFRGTMQQIEESPYGLAVFNYTIEITNNSYLLTMEVSPTGLIELPFSNGALPATYAQIMSFMPNVYITDPMGQRVLLSTLEIQDEIVITFKRELFSEDQITIESYLLNSSDELYCYSVTSSFSPTTVETNIDENSPYYSLFYSSQSSAK